MFETVKGFFGSFMKINSGFKNIVPRNRSTRIKSFLPTVINLSLVQGNVSNR